MSFTNLEALLARFAELKVNRILCKPLAENDNSKQQIYLGGTFESLQLIPYNLVLADPSSSTFKASLNLSWIDSAGHVARAPHSQLILYPRYPEVRLSGFLRGCPIAPAENLRPIPADLRRFNNGPDGRLLFVGTRLGEEVFAYLALPDSAVSNEFLRRRAEGRYLDRGVFVEVPGNSYTQKDRLIASPIAIDSGVLNNWAFTEPLPGFQRVAQANEERINWPTNTDLVQDPKCELIARLKAIHHAGWHSGKRLNGHGVLQSYSARNGGGYTLEALFGIVPNGIAEPDFKGWEIKAFSGSRITVMTPEPDGGYYGANGVGAFVKKYGRVTNSDTMYFTGTHKVGILCGTSGMTMHLRGFNPVTGRISDVSGSIDLMDSDDSVAARWSYQGLIAHWGRKHASAAYVPYQIDSDAADPRYRYESPILLGEGTDFSRYLSAMSAGQLVYDPGSKITGIATGKPKVKARSQFRATLSSLSTLYRKLSPVSL